MKIKLKSQRNIGRTVRTKYQSQTLRKQVEELREYRKSRHNNVAELVITNESSGNQYMTTMATKDANSSMNKYPCKPVSQNLPEQSPLHTTSSRNNASNNNIKKPQHIIQFQQNSSTKVVTNLNQDKVQKQHYTPASARGVRQHHKSRFQTPSKNAEQDEEEEEQMVSKSFINHNRNKTISAFMTKDQFSMKQNEIFDEIEDLRSQLAIFLQEDKKKKEQPSPPVHHVKQYSFMDNNGDDDNDDVIKQRDSTSNIQESVELESSKKLDQIEKRKPYNSQNMGAFQQMLDEIEQDTDVVMFKDTKGQLWEIVRHVSEVDQTESFDDDDDDDDDDVHHENDSEQENREAKNLSKYKNKKKQRLNEGSFIEHALQLEKANNRESEEGTSQISYISDNIHDDEEDNEYFGQSEQENKQLQFDDDDDKEQFHIQKSFKKNNEIDDGGFDIGKKVTTLSIISLGQGKGGTGEAEQLGVDTQEQVVLDQKWKKIK